MLKKGFKRKYAKLIRSHIKGKKPITIESLILNCKTVIVEKNKEVSIERFYQWKTYENMGCGLPFKEVNLGLIEELKERAKKYFNIDAFHLIEPEQTPIDYPFEYPYEPMGLPKVSCLAELYFADTHTELVIGWFQDDFTFPSNSEILTKIRNITWSKVSCEGPDSW